MHSPHNFPMSPLCKGKDEPDPVIHDPEDIRILKSINHSKYSVFVAESITAKKYYALKLYPYVNSRINPDFINEKRFFTLCHQNLVDMVDFQEKDSVTINEIPVTVSYCLLELAQYADFSSFVLSGNLPRSEKLARTFFNQLIAGVEYLH